MQDKLAYYSRWINQTGNQRLTIALGTISSLVIRLSTLVADTFASAERSKLTAQPGITSNIRPVKLESVQRHPAVRLCGLASEEATQRMGLADGPSQLGLTARGQNVGNSKLLLQYEMMTS